MGANQSATQEAMNIVYEFTQVSNDTESACDATNTQTQQMKITDVSGNVFVHDINWKQSSIMDTQCLQSSDTNTKLTNAIDQTASQITNQETSPIQFDLTNSTSDQITDQVVNLGTEVLNLTRNKCSSENNQSQTALVGTVGNNATVYGLTWEQLQKNTTECVQKNIQDTDEFQKVSQSISQESTQKVSSLATILIVIAVIIVLIIVIALVVKYTKKDTPEVQVIKAQKNAVQQQAKLQKQIANAKIAKAKLDKKLSTTKQGIPRTPSAPAPASAPAPTAHVPASAAAAAPAPASAAAAAAAPASGIEGGRSRRGGGRLRAPSSLSSWRRG